MTTLPRDPSSTRVRPIASELGGGELLSELGSMSASELIRRADAHEK